MSNTLTGLVHFIGLTKQVSDKFQTRDLVINDGNDKYPQLISFQCSQDKCALLDNLKKDQKVTVHYNIRGRHWKDDKYFNTLECWKIEAGEVPVNAAVTAIIEANNNTEIPDSLPF